VLSLIIHAEASIGHSPGEPRTWSH